MNSSIRSCDVEIRVVIEEDPTIEIVCGCFPSPKLNYKEIGTIKIRVTEGDFPHTVREAALEQFRKSSFRDRTKACYFDVFSSRDHNIIHTYGQNVRFITDGHRLYMSGLWEYGRVEPCDKMTAVVRYTRCPDHSKS